MNDNDDIRREAKTRLHRSRADASVYCVRYHRDPLVHGEEEPGASSEHEHCIGHFVTPCSAPAQKLERPILAASWLGYGTFVHRVKIGFPQPRYLLNVSGLVPSTMLRTWRFVRSAPELVTSIPVICGKGEGRMSWSWLLAMLLGAAMMANVGEGWPMSEYRGSWRTQASR